MDNDGSIIVEQLLPRIYINSFPKSGTHLAILISLHMAAMQKPKHWLGTFRRHSWSKEWMPDHKVIGVIRGQPAGTWMMGHMGYKPDFAAAFQEMGTCMLFVYRDLRDVAISQTYHIENDDDERFKHPDKTLYTDMPTHEDRLNAVISGIDHFPGVVERWELYAPWLDVDWVLPIRFEDMRSDPNAVADRAVSYIVKRTMAHSGALPLVVEENYKLAIKRSIAQMQTTEHSGSFRTGKSGNWKDEFTPELHQAFDQTGGDAWIKRLGYEQYEPA